MTGETLSPNTIAIFNEKTEMNMMVIAALWSDNTPLPIWPAGFDRVLEKLARPNEFELQLDELSNAVARFKLAESSFSKEKDSAEQESELLGNDPTLYLVPTKFQKKRPLLQSVKISPSDLRNFSPEPLKTTISRKELARYAIARKQNPDFLDKDIKDLLPESEKPVPPYLDRNHPNFSEELYIAVVLWEKLCKNLERKPKEKMTDYLENELRKNYRLDSSGAITRIRIVANPDRFKPHKNNKSKKK